MLYMMLVTVFGNKLNKQRFFFILGWGKHSISKNNLYMHVRMYNRSSYSNSWNFYWNST